MDRDKETKSEQERKRTDVKKEKKKKMKNRWNSLKDDNGKYKKDSRKEFNYASLIWCSFKTSIELGKEEMG
jgi:hypothetical protein